MEQFKRVSVVMLPTKEKSKFGLVHEINKLHIYTNGDNPHDMCDNLAINQHLYFLSNDKIEEGDWVKDCFGIHKAIKEGELVCRKAISNSNVFFATDAKKIIATTDISLTKEMYCVSSGKYQEPIPQPSQQFIEKYVEAYNAGKPITEVLVEYKYCCEQCEEILNSHKYCPNACTTRLGNSKLKVNPKDNTITIRRLKESWNRDEVIELLGNMRTADIKAGSLFSLKQWIKENL